MLCCYLFCLFIYFMPYFVILLFVIHHIFYFLLLFTFTLFLPFTLFTFSLSFILYIKLNSLAKSMNILRGTLSRWLLPYDNNTRIDEQCSTPHSVVDNMPDIMKGRISERQVHYLVGGANGVRRLVRIKIADDNDLEQARVALHTTMVFFKKLKSEATKNDLTEFELLKLRFTSN